MNIAFSRIAIGPAISCCTAAGACAQPRAGGIEGALDDTLSLARTA
ncbi:hypothetical protein [Pantoea sp. 18069]|nr:hypothetical protein [Pantoea sp. 18069]